jgi:alanyl-tRNA synthetase
VTERLYYTDPYLAEFDARIVGVEWHEGHPAAILDRTAFYPTSGGQPFDTGRLGSTAVIDVVDRDDGAILHVLERGIDPGPVHATIDWPRRFEHMQQHTGQHILSAAFDRLLKARTESFHLGSSASTIDVNRNVSADEVTRVEDEANRIVWEDRPVGIRFADASEVANMPLRKETSREGTVRLIEVPDFDISACGGTHVARTGAIGAIVVQSTERFRGGTRIEFLCGTRAVRGFRALRDSVAASVRLVSVLPAELPAGIERLQAEAKDTKRQLKDLQNRLSAFEAQSLVARAEPRGSLRVVSAVLEGWDQVGLKAIASAIAAHPGHVAMIFGGPAPAAVVVARAADATIDSAALLQHLVTHFGGKGGGRAELAQGGGLQGAPDDFVSFARGLI